MAQVQHNCTGCVPIDASIIEVYTQLISTESRAEEAAERAEHAAEYAIGKSPYIGENGDWWEWDDEQAAFIDTGVQAQGQVAVDVEMSTTSTNPVQNRVVTAAVNEKQDTLVSGTNIKTVNGESLLGEGNIIAGDPNAVKYVEQTLTDAQKAQARTNIAAYQKPAAGIPATDLTSAAQTSLGKADSAYQKPGSGIPKADLDSSVQTSLGKADTAIQDISGKQDVISDLSTIRSGAAAGATAYQKPSGGIPKSDLSSGVQGSLDLADSAIQARPQGEITPVITPADYATREELGELEAKVTDLDSELNGASETVFVHSQFEDTPGIIIGGVFQNNGVYGTNNDFVLIPVSQYRGRSLYVLAQPSNQAAFAFLTSDALVSGQVPPFCQSEQAVRYLNGNNSTTITIPDDCNYIYVYVRHGSDGESFPEVLKILAVESNFYTKTEVDSAIEAVSDDVSDTNEELNALDDKVSAIEDSLPIEHGWLQQDTSSGDYSLANPLKRMDGGAINVSTYNGSGVTNPITIDHTKRYKLRTSVRSLFDGVSYYNSGGTYIGSDVFESSSSTPSIIEAELNIPSNAVTMRFGTYNDADAYQVYIYGTKYNDVAALEDLERVENSVSDLDDRITEIEQYLPTSSEWVAQDTTSGPYKPTNQNSGNNGALLLNGNIQPSSLSTALVTDPIEIDHSKRYKLRTQIDNYFDGLAYYQGNTFIGYDVFHTTGASQIIEAELTIPSNATHFRLASQNVTTAYEISILERMIEPLVTESELAAVEAQVEQAQEDIQDLYGIAEAAGTMDVARAVRYIPTKDLYLGADILTLTGATYNPTYWAVENGVVKYLGGGSQSTPFVFASPTTEGGRYLAELTAAVATPGFENLFNIKIGDGPLVDTYNGAANTRGGVVSDGGLFTIVPVSTKAFDLTSVTLSPVLASDESAGYQRTVSVPVDNISCGNSAQTLIDGKWNVAIGPPANTMAKNTGGSRSVAIGLNALRNWHAGLQNVAIGTFAMSLLEEGDHNIAIGGDAMWQAKKASDNIVIGRGALGKTGEYSEMLRNVAIGFTAMGSQQANTHDSVSIGHRANIYGASLCVFVGSEAMTTNANSGITNAICIGYNARATKSNQCVLGNTSVTEFVLGNKKLVFNNDNTVSWETIS